MKIGLRHKIIGTNLIVLALTFVVISGVVIEGLNGMNRRMLIQNLTYQSEISVISIKQSLLSGDGSSSKEGEFNARSRDFALRLSSESGLRVLFFSRTKKLLADSEASKPLVSEFSELDEVLRGNRTYVIRRHEGSRHMCFTFPVMQQGSVIGMVMLIHPLDEMDNNLKNIQLLLLLSFVIGIAIILAVSIPISIGITNPILKLKDSAKQVSEGSFSGRIDIRSNDEVGELASAFKTMQYEIEKRITMINVEKSKLDSVLESMGEGVVALDGADRIIAVNSRAQSVLDEHARRHISRIAQKVRESGTRAIVEIGLEGKNLLVCGTPLPLDMDGGGVVLVLNDMTELRLLQEKQRQFVTNVSHELKTPLTTIMGYIDLLAEKGGDREVFEKSVKYLSDASDRLMRLVNDLIDLSSISKFEFEIEPRSTDLSALVRDITGQMSLKAQKFSIKISTDLPATPEILVDPVRIKQAMVNILDNAIKYSPGGTISVSIKEDMENIIITVSDSGCGIPEDMLEKVFEPFYRVDRARSRNMGGNGLGLAITKEIIEKHMGKVEIESRVGKGTTVRLILPKQ